MDFFSIEFVLFLFVALILYYLFGVIKKKDGSLIVPQWIILLFASLFFYGFINVWYLVFIGFSAIVSYLCAFFSKYRISSFKVEEAYYNPSRDLNLTILSVSVNILILAVLKYYNFFANSINFFGDANLPIFEFLIPLGISFYTFSLVSYNIDVYRENCVAEKNILKFILFTIYFPKILQGPIQSFNSIKKDGGLFSRHYFNDVEFLPCFYRISIGVIKKVAVANILNFYVNSIYSNYDSVSSIILVIGTIFYSIQLYCDFSGFLDMVIGISGLFGIKLTENFDSPYLSSSIKEFWRRWHITLGAWLKNYIYIPLGGNKVSLRRWIVNTIIVWLVSGIWHGANWTFVIWGIYHGFLLIIEKLIDLLRKTKKSDKTIPFVLKAMNVLKTFLLVNLGWVFFRAPSIDVALNYIWRMATFQNGTYDVFSNVSISNEYLIISLIVILVLIFLSLHQKIFSFKKNIVGKNMTNMPKFNKAAVFIITCVFISVGIFLTIYINSIGGGDSSFIYFDF